MFSPSAAIAEACRSPARWTEEYVRCSLHDFMIGHGHPIDARPTCCTLFVMYASPVVGFQRINFESEIQRILCSARESGRLQTGEISLSVGCASSASLTKLLTLSHAQSGGLILHLAAHGDEHGGLVLESARGTGEAHVCPREKLMKVLNIGGRGLRGVSLLVAMTCNSQSLSQIFVDCGCQHVIATSRTVMDSTARAFSERFYSALFVGKTIATAFQDTREVLRASSQPEMAKQSDAFVLLSSPDSSGEEIVLSGGSDHGECATEFPDSLDKPMPASRQCEYNLEGFQDVSVFQDMLTLLPPHVEDYFHTPTMQQILLLLRSRRACAIHGPPGIGKSAIGTELARFSSNPGRLFSSNVLHVQLVDKGKALQAIREALDPFLGCVSHSLPSGAPLEDESKRVVWELQQLERLRPHAPLLLVLDDECKALKRSKSLKTLLADLLRKTHRLVILFLSREPLHESIGSTKVVNIDLAGLDEQRAANLFLRRVHRPLLETDFKMSRFLPEDWAPDFQLLHSRNGVVELLLRSQVLAPLQGNPGLLREVGSLIVPHGKPLPQVLELVLSTRNESVSR